MSETLLIIGIILTSLAITALTVFSLSNFILKRIYKEKEQNKTKEEKQRDKILKRSIKFIKKLLKDINHKLLSNLLAFYGITSVALVGGATMTTLGAVQVVQERSLVPSSEISSSSEEESSESSSATSSSESSSESSSSSSSEPASTIYTISFYDDDDTLILIQEVVKGHKATNYEPPHKPGFTFEAWYYEKPYANVFTFDDDITSDLSLYACYTIKTMCTVTFFDGDTVVDEQEVAVGDYASLTNAPDKVDHIFDAWYKEPSFENEFDFMEQIYDDTNVYAKYNHLWLVRYLDQSDKEIDSTIVEDGSFAENIQRQESSSGLYYHWFTSKGTSDEQYAFPFQDPITSDIIIYGYPIE